MADAKKYFPELDFIKAIAILMVVGFHFFGQLSGWHLHVVNSEWFFDYWKGFSWWSLATWMQGESWLRAAKFGEAYGYLGVNLFVIASGFGLYYSYCQKKTIFQLSEFFRKRLLRLLPGAAFAIIIVFAMKVLLLKQWPVNDWYLNFFPFLGGLNLFADQWFFPPIDGEMWFLGLIIQLYLFFPLLMLGLKKYGNKKFLIGLLLITIGFRALYYWLWKDTISSFSYGLSVGRLFEFGFGMVLAQQCADEASSVRTENRHCTGKGIKPHPAWMGGLLLFWGYFFAWSFPFSDALVGVGLFTLLWLLAQKFLQKTEAKVLTKAQQAESVRAGGGFWMELSAASYYIFLIHHPLIWGLQAQGFTEWWSLSGVAFFFAIVLVSYGLAWAMMAVLKKLRLG